MLKNYISKMTCLYVTLISKRGELRLNFYAKKSITLHVETLAVLGKEE